MAKVSCAICNRKRDEQVCRAFKPTKAERANLIKLGETNPQEVYYYCRPCMRVVENPASAIELMRGVVRNYAQAFGVPNADGFADRYKARLLGKVKPKPVS